jgi:Electron transfer DM13
MIAFGDILAILYEQRVLVAVLSVVAVVVALVVARRLGVDRAARRRPRVAGSIVAIVLVAGLPLAWYLASPLFIRTQLVEPPVVAAVDPLPTPASPASTPEPEPQATATASPRLTEAIATPPPPAAPRSGEFQGTDEFHFGRGTATLVQATSGEWVLRFDDFSVRNGPDLFVYLSPARDDYADGALEVARLKATDGSFNVPLPAGTDPAAFDSVLIWCKQFSHLFAFATLDG